MQLISLDVTIDSHPRLDRHARNVAKECNYDVRALRHVRGLLTDDVAQMIACIIVPSTDVWVAFLGDRFKTVRPMLSDRCLSDLSVLSCL